jgi:hypothetical protein
MDKIFSARLDESVLSEMDRVVYQQHMTKKKFLEQAIHHMAETLSVTPEKDIWALTCGAWKRKESASTIIKQIRSKTRENFERHQR